MCDKMTMSACLSSPAIRQLHSLVEPIVSFKYGVHHAFLRDFEVLPPPHLTKEQTRQTFFQQIYYKFSAWYASESFPTILIE